MTWFYLLPNIVAKEAGGRSNTPGHQVSKRHRNSSQCFANLAATTAALQSLMLPHAWLPLEAQKCVGISLLLSTGLKRGWTHLFQNSNKQVLYLEFSCNTKFRPLPLTKVMKTKIALPLLIQASPSLSGRDLFSMFPAETLPRSLISTSCTSLLNRAPPSSRKGRFILSEARRKGNRPFSLIMYEIIVRILYWEFTG